MNIFRIFILFIFVNFLLISPLFSPLCFAYPEMVSHGYFSCTTCHISPSGGGVLTEYGRSLSKELLSTWGSEGEEKFLYAISETENLHFGGNIRSVQTYLDDPRVRTGDYFLMQSDLELSLTLKNWILDVTAGTQGGPKNTPNKDTFLSRRHYVGYKIVDPNGTAEWILRYGRFLVNYGHHQANHMMVTERDLQFDQGRETYNTEASYLGEKLAVCLSHMAGRPDDPTVDGMRGVAASVALSIKEKNLVGLSGLSSKTNGGGIRQLAGIYGLWVPLENFFWLFEYDHQWRQPNLSPGVTTEEKGVVAYNRLNYQAYKGINLYALHQLRYLNYHTPRNRFDAWGIGLQLFPRPHLEFQAEFQKQKDLGRFDIYYDMAWVMFHYYL